MTYDEALALLEEHEQGHVLRYWEQLDDAAREALLAQVSELDFERIAGMREVVRGDHTAADLGDFTPAPVVDPGDDERAAATAAGEAAIRDGKVGVVLVAGGQGSRLGYDGPKGCYPVGAMSGASLFEIHAHKILALERAYDAEIPFYVMTSQVNDAPTRAFFVENNYFGLTAERVRFFAQGMLPALTAEGDIVLDAPGHIFMSPDGHGGILRALDVKGMLADMEARAVDVLYYFQVDNPLVDIAAPAMIGLHLQREADITVKVCAKRDAEEPIGVVVEREGRTAVVEYSELTPEQMHATTDDGELLYKYGSVAIHAFSRAFLQEQARADLPYHLAHKKIPRCNDAGEVVKPDAPNGYKFERFIFDVLPNATRPLMMAFSREEEFSPVKNPSGPDSLESAQRDMTHKFTRWLAAAGVDVPRDDDGNPAVAIEIDPLFARSPEELADAVTPELNVSADLLLAGE